MLLEGGVGMKQSKKMRAIPKIQVLLFFLVFSFGVGEGVGGGGWSSCFGTPKYEVPYYNL